MSEDVRSERATWLAMLEQRRIDDLPCPKCGGDRLRPDFTGSGRCHAERQTS